MQYMQWSVHALEAAAAAAAAASAVCTAVAVAAVSRLSSKQQVIISTDPRRETLTAAAAGPAVQSYRLCWCAVVMLCGSGGMHIALSVTGCAVWLSSCQRAASTVCPSQVVQHMLECSLCH